MNSFAGMNIVQTPLAVSVRVEFKVSRWMTRDKKRKNWRVLRIEHRTPCVFQAGGVFYMHPALFAELKVAAK